MKVRRVAIALVTAGAVATIGLLAELVANAASAEQRWPVWLVPLQQHPWLALGILAVATALLAVFVSAPPNQPPNPKQSREDRKDGSELPDPALAAVTTTVTNSLPRDVEVFAGRDREMSLLLEAGRGGAGYGHAPRICSIDGMPGVGKTTLAVRVAHTLSQDFPDGQIFMHLHGHALGEPPVDPAETLAALLIGSGVAAQRVPVGMDARAAMWRDRLRERKVILVLDDAVSSEQIRPLLPGATQSFVIITSRRRLSALEGATPLSLTTLAPDDAAALFTRLAHRSDLQPADNAVTALARLCGWLPLALRLAAGQLQHHRAWSAEHLLERLATAHDRVSALQSENASIYAAFDLSYRELATDLQRLFRRLGKSPGESFDAYAVAALDDVDLAAARVRLDDLYQDHLVEEPVYGRYRMHDLIRAHAQGLTRTEELPETGRAVQRLVNYYLHTAVTAGRLLARRTLIASSGLPTGPPAWMPSLSTQEQAADWLEAERANLVLCTDYAARCGWPLHAVYISVAIGEYLFSQGPWEQALAIHHDAVGYAKAAQDPTAQAEAHQTVGIIQQLAGHSRAALDNQRRAVDLYRSLGNAQGEAQALNEISVVQRQTARYAEAEASAQQALKLFEEAGDDLGRASALHNLGYARQMTGAYAASIADLKYSLSLAHKCGDRLGQAQASDRLSFSQLAVGDYVDAADSAVHALESYRSVRNRVGEANATNVLGLLKRLAGDYAGAAADHKEALARYRGYGDHLGEANALNYLGIAQQLMGDYEEALSSQTMALQLSRTRDDERVLVANVLNDLGVVQRLLGDPAAAEASHREALKLYDEIGDRLGKANALNYLGVIAIHSHDDQAESYLASARQLYADIGERLGQAEVLNSLGDLARLSPDGRDAHLTQALAYYTAAAELAREINSPLEEARAIEGVGQCMFEAGALSDALVNLRDAHAIYQRIGTPDARRLESILDQYP
jgi:tetratricopeptide (TPR) repeat protein